MGLALAIDLSGAENDWDRDWLDRDIDQQIIRNVASARGVLVSWLE